MQQVRRLLFAIIFIFALFAGLYFALPAALNAFLVPKIAAALPFNVAEMNISTFNLHQFTADLTVGSANTKALHIPKITINYSPSGLWAKRLDSIVIDSPSINLEVNNGTLTIPGMLPSQTAAEKSNAGEDLLVLPVLTGEIQLRQLRLSAKTGSREYSLLANASLRPKFISDTTGTGNRLTELTIELDTAGAVKSSFTARLKDSRGEQHLHIDGTVEDLSSLQVFLQADSALRLAGYSRLTAEVALNGFAEIISSEGRLTFPELSLQYGANSLESAADAPLQIHFSGTPANLHAELVNGRISGIEEASFTATADFAPSSKTLQAGGRITPDSLGATLDFSVNGNFADDTPVIAYTINGQNLQSPQFTAESASIAGEALFRNGKITTTNQADLTSLSFSNAGLSAAGISVNLPLTLPLTEDHISRPGTVSVAGLRSADTHLGDIAGTFTVAPDAAGFDLSAKLAPHPELELACSGNAVYSGDVSIDCTLPQTHFDSKQLAADIPFPEDIELTGKVTAELHLEIRGTVPSGTARLQLSDATLTSGTNTLVGINADVLLPNLPKIESAPGQLCTIDSLNAGKIGMSDGKIFFRVESPESIFIERSRFSWCSGKVETAGVRLSTSKKEVQTTLYCDRLNMAQLLAQFGLADTEGQGSLNGRLPVYFNQDGIDIEDGFLFSTPGDSGIVHFNDTKQIKEGLPNIDQTAYLDYAVKSLENFSYNWTKLTFTKDQNDLLVKMQLDGAPAAPLPFGYQNGNIVKTDKGSGIQHPIRLDVNFRFPLQDLFRYGKNVQSIMENM